MTTNAIHGAKTPYFRGRTESVTRGGHVYPSSPQGLTDYRGRSVVDELQKATGFPSNSKEIVATLSKEMQAAIRKAMKPWKARARAAAYLHHNEKTEAL